LDQETERRPDSRKLELNAYLTKPIRPQELDEVLQAYVSQRLETKEAREGTLSKK